MNDFFQYFDGSDATIPVWVMILVSFLLGLIYKSLGCGRNESDEAALAGAALGGAGGLVTEKAEISAAAAEDISAPSSVKDDLQIIEGIGPKVEGVLNNADIETYRRLADSNATELRGILDNAGPAYKVIVPDSWPEQAKLAAEGRWDELKEYQEYLVGGVDPAKLPEAQKVDDSTIQPLMGSADVEELKTDTDATVAAAAGAAAAGGKLAASKPDDLKIVEGIGPKIEELFHNAGIMTWKDLSETSPDKLREILRAAGSRFQMHDPATWPEQARLAAEGKWEELEEYQDFLQGGRA